MSENIQNKIISFLGGLGQNKILSNKMMIM